MAGRGPAPSATPSASARPRDTKRRVSDKSISLTRDGAVRGPELVEATGRGDWCPQVETYWQTWRTSPQAQAFEVTDWQRLAMLVPLVEAYWTLGADKGTLGEIRLNEERLGATVRDRQALVMRIEEAEEAKLYALPGGADEELLA
jgi:hypothetical protein